MSEPNYSAADLDRIFGPGAAAHAAAQAAPATEDLEQKATDALGKIPQAIDAAKTFYHLYVCPWIDCLKAANPVSGSWHQRGVHLANASPRTDVKCPGCGKAMVIGRDGLDDEGKPLPQGQITSDANGNAVLHGDPIIQLAPGQPDQTAEIEAENER